VLQLALYRMGALNQQGGDGEIIKTADRYRARWKGNAVFYERLTGAHWGASHWREAVHFGRMALALDSGRPQTVAFMLAAYREWNPRQGILFGESWLRKHRLTAKISRHLSFLYDDLDRPAEALAIARRGSEQAPRDRQLAACVANYLAKVEGPASALEFARSRQLLAGDPYAPDTVANGLSSVRAYPEAEKIFADLHRRFPGNNKYLVSLLDALFHQGRYRELLATFERRAKKFAPTGAVVNEVGRACLELGRNDEAMAWFQRARELAPDSTKFADNYAVALGRAGRHAEGIAACQRRLAAPDAPDRRRLLTSLGADHSHLGRHEEAFRFYQQAFAEFPENDGALVDLISGYNWLDRSADAIAFALPFRATRGPRLPARYWSELAWALHKAGRFAEEEEVIAEWHRLHPDDADVARTMRRALNSLGRKEEALVFVRTWAAAHPADANGWRSLAFQHEECGQAEEQLAALVKGGELAPEDAGLVSERVATLRQLRRFQEAYDVGTGWDEAHPGGATAELLNRVGLAADDLEAWPAAERLLRRAHLLEPAHGKWIGNLLRALVYGKKEPEAVELGRVWLAGHPWQGYVAARVAWAMRAADLPAEEETVLRQAVAAEPEDEEWRHLLLSNLVGRKLTDEAAAWVDDCRQAGRASGRIFNDWANHLRDVGKFDASEAAYREALAKGPDNDTAAGNLVSLFTLAGRTGPAIEFGTQWLERRPDDHYVRRQLAEACYMGDDFARAETEFRRVRETDPESAFLTGRITACLRLTNKLAEAIAEGTTWVQTRPGTAFLFIELGIAARLLGRADEALRHYDSALALDPAASAAALRRMRVLGEEQRLGEAMDFGRQWSAAHPAHANADFQNELGILLDRGKRPAEAQEHFVRAAELDPQNATLAGNAVEILARRGHLAESLQLGQRALASAPPNAYLLRRLAEAYGLHHEHGAALDLLASADVLEAEDPEIALEFLRQAQAGGELERGLEFGRAWLARPANAGKAGVWARLARVCFRADEDDEAFAAVQRAMEIEPDEIAHRRLQFGFWSALEDGHRLVKEFEAIRPEWRDDAVLLRYTSRAYAELGMPDEALYWAVHNTRINPGDDDACAWLAELYERTDRTELAHECVRAWVALHGEHPAVLKVRARLAWREKAYVPALADVDAVLREDQADEEAFILGVRILRALGRGAEARGRLNHWLEHQGSSSRVARLLDEEKEDNDR
jgi:tetratricopeptide (TPR) repeat protein